MPSTYVYVDVPGNVYDDDLMFVMRGSVAGIRQDFDGAVVEPMERYEEADIILEDVLITALDELWAITPITTNLCDDLTALYAATVQERGAVDLRISVDGGTTWLHWNAGWVPITGTEWTSFKDLNENLTVIPFAGERRLKFWVRLRRGTNPKLTPLFRGLRLGYALVPDHLFEDPHRTMRRFFETNLRIHFRTKHRFKTAGEQSYVSPVSFDLDFPVVGLTVSKIFNLTADPTRLTNLLVGSLVHGYVSAEKRHTNVVTVSSPPTAGDILEVEWVASVPVTLAHKDLNLNDETMRHVPQLVVQILQSAEAKDLKLSTTYGNYTVNHPLSIYFNEQHSVPVDYRVQIYSVAADESLAIKILDAAYRTLRDFTLNNPFRLVMSGALAEAVNYDPPFTSFTDTSEKLSVKVFAFILYATEWFGTVIEGPLAEDIQIQTDLMETT